MGTTVLCGHCETPAIAELDGDYLCAGCLMNIMMCIDEPLNVRPLKGCVDGVVPEASVALKQVDSDCP